MSQGSASGTVVKGVVSDTAETYVEGEIKSISINTEGRLRVSQVAAAVYIEFFRVDAPLSFNVPDLTNASNPWEIGEASPWPT